MFVTPYPLSSKYAWSTSPFACWNHMSILSDQFWPLVTSVSFICCTKQLSLVLEMFCLAQVRSSFWLLNAMHGLSYSRSDTVICCSFLTLDAIKFVHCVNRLEWPLTSNYFEYHHYLLFLFSTVKHISLHHRNGSVLAETFLLPSAAVSSNASAGISLTALIFSTAVLPPFFLNCGRF